MEKELSPAVVIILLDNDRVLLEKRPETDEYPEADIFPGGKVEKEDQVDTTIKEEWLTIINALNRETMEELGVSLCWFYELPQPEVTLSPMGRIMHPFVVTDWGGKDLPERILDNGHPIFWEELDNVLFSPIPSVSKIAEDLKSFLHK